MKFNTVNNKECCLLVLSVDRAVNKGQWLAKSAG